MTPLPVTPTNRLRVRSDGASVHGTPSGRPRKTATSNQYSLKGYRRIGYESDTRHEIICIAALDGTPVGSLHGYLVDLRLYRTAMCLALDMDAISQGTFDVAEHLRPLGTGFWRKRDLLLFLETATVAQPHRRRGLASALGELALSTASAANREITVILQPWPLEFDTVEPHEVNGQQIITDTEWDREMATLTGTWLKVFPFLKFSGMGGLGGDRSYYLGQVPQP